MAYALIVYFVSGQVFKGSWRGAKVALKVLMTEDGVTPSSMVCPGYQFHQHLRYLPLIAQAIRNEVKVGHPSSQIWTN
jgi:hypothetical protein